MAEYWATCEDMTRNVEDQRVAFGPFLTKREARAFGWALAYSENDRDYLLSIGVRKGDDLNGRLRITINPEIVVSCSITSIDWDDLTTWPDDRE